MKKLGIIFALTILLAGGAIGSMPSLSQAQVYAPPPVASCNGALGWAEYAMGLLQR